MKIVARIITTILAILLVQVYCQPHELLTDLESFDKSNYTSGLAAIPLQIIDSGERYCLEAIKFDAYEITDGEGSSSTTDICRADDVTCCFGSHRFHYFAFDVGIRHFRANPIDTDLAIHEQEAKFYVYPIFESLSDTNDITYIHVKIQEYTKANCQSAICAELVDFTDNCRGVYSTIECQPTDLSGYEERLVILGHPTSDCEDPLLCTKHQNPCLYIEDKTPEGYTCSIKFDVNEIPEGESSYKVRIGYSDTVDGKVYELEGKTHDILRKITQAEIASNPACADTHYLLNDDSFELTLKNHADQIVLPSDLDETYKITVEICGEQLEYSRNDISEGVITVNLESLTLSDVECKVNVDYLYEEGDDQYSYSTEASGTITVYTFAAPQLDLLIEDSSCSQVDSECMFDGSAFKEFLGCENSYSIMVGKLSGLPLSLLIQNNGISFDGVETIPTINDCASQLQIDFKPTYHSLQFKIEYTDRNHGTYTIEADKTSISHIECTNCNNDPLFVPVGGDFDFKIEGKYECDAALILSNINHDITVAGQENEDYDYSDDEWNENSFINLKFEKSQSYTVTFKYGPTDTTDYAVETDPFTVHAVAFEVKKKYCPDPDVGTSPCALGPGGKLQFEIKSLNSEFENKLEDLEVFITEKKDCDYDCLTDQENGEELEMKNGDEQEDDYWELDTDEELPRGTYYLKIFYDKVLYPIEHPDDEAVSPPEVKDQRYLESDGAFNVIGRINEVFIAQRSGEKGDPDFHITVTAYSRREPILPTFIPVDFELDVFYFYKYDNPIYTLSNFTYKYENPEKVPCIGNDDCEFGLCEDNDEAENQYYCVDPCEDYDELLVACMFCLETGEPCPVELPCEGCTCSDPVLPKCMPRYRQVISIALDHRFDVNDVPYTLEVSREEDGVKKPYIPPFYFHVTHGKLAELDVLSRSSGTDEEGNQIINHIAGDSVEVVFKTRNAHKHVIPYDNCPTYSSKVYEIAALTLTSSECYDDGTIINPVLKYECSSTNYTLTFDVMKPNTCKISFDYHEGNNSFEIEIGKGDIERLEFIQPENQETFETGDVLDVVIQAYNSNDQEIEVDNIEEEFGIEIDDISCYELELNDNGQLITTCSVGDTVTGEFGELKIMMHNEIYSSLEFKVIEGKIHTLNVAFSEDEPDDYQLGDEVSIIISGFNKNGKPVTITNDIVNEGLFKFLCGEEECNTTHSINDNDELAVTLDTCDYKEATSFDFTVIYNDEVIGGALKINLIEGELDSLEIVETLPDSFDIGDDIHLTIKGYNANCFVINLELLGEDSFQFECDCVKSHSYEDGLLELTLDSSVGTVDDGLDLKVLYKDNSLLTKKFNLRNGSIKKVYGKLDACLKPVIFDEDPDIQCILGESVSLSDIKFINNFDKQIEPDSAEIQLVCDNELLETFDYVSNIKEYTIDKLETISKKCRFFVFYTEDGDEKMKNIYEEDGIVIESFGVSRGNIDSFELQFKKVSECNDICEFVKGEPIIVEITKFENTKEICITEYVTVNDLKDEIIIEGALVKTSEFSLTSDGLVYTFTIEDSDVGKYELEFNSYTYSLTFNLGHGEPEHIVLDDDINVILNDDRPTMEFKLLNEYGVEIKDSLNEIVASSDEYDLDISYENGIGTISSFNNIEFAKEYTFTVTVHEHTFDIPVNVLRGNFDSVTAEFIEGDVNGIPNCENNQCIYGSKVSLKEIKFYNQFGGDITEHESFDAVYRLSCWENNELFELNFVNEEFGYEVELSAIVRGCSFIARVTEESDKSKIELGITTPKFDIIRGDIDKFTIDIENNTPYEKGDIVYVEVNGFQNTHEKLIDITRDDITSILVNGDIVIEDFDIWRNIMKFKIHTEHIGVGNYEIDITMLENDPQHASFELIYGDPVSIVLDDDIEVIFGDEDASFGFKLFNRFRVLIEQDLSISPTEEFDISYSEDDLGIINNFNFDVLTVGEQKVVIEIEDVDFEITVNTKRGTPYYVTAESLECGEDGCIYGSPAVLNGAKIFNEKNGLIVDTSDLVVRYKLLCRSEHDFNTDDTIILPEIASGCSLYAQITESDGSEYVKSVHNCDSDEAISIDIEKGYISDFRIDSGDSNIEVGEEREIVVKGFENQFEKPVHVEPEDIDALDNYDIVNNEIVFKHKQEEYSTPGPNTFTVGTKEATVNFNVIYGNPVSLEQTSENDIVFGNGDFDITFDLYNQYGIFINENKSVVVENGNYKFDSQGHRLTISYESVAKLGDYSYDVKFGGQVIGTINFTVLRGSSFEFKLNVETEELSIVLGSSVYEIEVTAISNDENGDSMPYFDVDELEFIVSFNEDEDDIGEESSTLSDSYEIKRIDQHRFSFNARSSGVYIIEGITIDGCVECKLYESVSLGFEDGKVESLYITLRDHKGQNIEDNTIIASNADQYSIFVVGVNEYGHHINVDDVNLLENDGLSKLVIGSEEMKFNPFLHTYGYYTIDGASESGEYNLVFTYERKAIRGSYFTINILPSNVDPKESFIGGNGVDHARASKETSVRLTLKDRFLNVIGYNKYDMTITAKINGESNIKLSIRPESEHVIITYQAPSFAESEFDIEFFIYTDFLGTTTSISKHTVKLLSPTETANIPSNIGAGDLYEVDGEFFLSGTVVVSGTLTFGPDSNINVTDSFVNSQSSFDYSYGDVKTFATSGPMFVVEEGGSLHLSGSLVFNVDSQESFDFVNATSLSASSFKVYEDDSNDEEDEEEEDKPRIGMTVLVVDGPSTGSFNYQVHNSFNSCAIITPHGYKDNETGNSYLTFMLAENEKCIEESSLKGYAIAGIVLGCLLLIAIIVIVVLVVIIKKPFSKKEKEEPSSTRATNSYAMGAVPESKHNAYYESHEESNQQEEEEDDQDYDEDDYDYESEETKESSEYYTTEDESDD